MIPKRRLMSLKQELEAFQAAFTASMSPETVAVMARGDAEVEALRITDRALKAGDFAPEFNLPDGHGHHVRLSRLLARGPVVIKATFGYVAAELNRFGLAYLHIVEPRIKGIELIREAKHRWPPRTFGRSSVARSSPPEASTERPPRRSSRPVTPISWRSEGSSSRTPTCPNVSG
jgi:hypothetical protein